MKLTELIEIDILQKIQDSFSKFTGMASITTNPEGVPSQWEADSLNFV